MKFQSAFALMAIAGAANAVRIATTDDNMETIDDTGLELSELGIETTDDNMETIDDTGLAELGIETTSLDSSEPGEIRRSGPVYDFPGWDVVEKTGEPFTLDTSGREGADFSISWFDGLAERHSVQFVGEDIPQTYAFFPPTATEEGQKVFKWFDGETWTETVVADDCGWLVVEFRARSGEFYPDPYVKMDVQCVAW